MMDLIGDLRPAYLFKYAGRLPTECIRAIPRENDDVSISTPHHPGTWAAAEPEQARPGSVGGAARSES